MKRVTEKWTDGMSKGLSNKLAVLSDRKIFTTHLGENVSLLLDVDAIRVRSVTSLDPEKRGELGQYFTSEPISRFMASLFSKLSGDIRLLDPGCGPCSLTAAFAERALSEKPTAITSTCYDIEERIKPFATESLKLCESQLRHAGINFKPNLKVGDFILESAENSGIFDQNTGYTHVIANPPYKKIATKSDHRKALRVAGIETVNLYSGFIYLAIQKLSPGGEIVAIIPRSFCNGPYYKAFREFLLNECSLKHIHIFDSRNSAFAEDEVLQENIIFHAQKGGRQGRVTITSSPSADFHFDMESGTVSASDMTTREVSFESIVKPEDADNFIHIAANERDQKVIDRLACFSSTLSDLGITVSTGPVVSFRLREYLRDEIEDDSVPLLYPQHLAGTKVEWPKQIKQANAIKLAHKTLSWLYKNDGNYVLTRRFSSKEERRRIVATYYDGSLPGELIGFENKTNVFHCKKSGIDSDLAKGLAVFLNCTLLDKYYRVFGGHTQVNATDLRSLHYPDFESLRRIGSNADSLNFTQQSIDNLVNKEIESMTGSKLDPLIADEKISQAIEIIEALGIPKAQQNERSAFTLLALLNLSPDRNWSEAERPMIGVTPIMNWCRDTYGKEYAPNTRETFRRQTLHQFGDGGMTLYNPDKPDRPVNSPAACYQIASELFELLRLYGSQRWATELKSWLKVRQTLVAQYAKERDMSMIPLTLEDGTEIKLSPGVHSKLIHDIVVEFGPRFAPGSQVIYLGDTGAKEDFFRKERLAELGVTVDRKGKLPDVVLYWPEKDWLLLIESVTSHGPVDGKRYGELKTLFAGAKPGLVYVTAFPDRKVMNKYLPHIAWETEVWIADAPTHMIHFNGDRFLGPHE
jgi:adenine-specific DNA-methyltransferase